MGIFILCAVMALCGSLVAAQHSCTDSSECAMGFICVDNYCSSCFNSSQCAAIYNVEYICRHSRRGIFNGSTVCLHKNIAPFSWQDFLAFLLILVFTALASTSGVGGGGLIVPILILVTRFIPRDAVPLSTLAVFAGSVGTLTATIRKRHPTQNAPLILYQIAMLLQPAALLGTTVGVILNNMFPDWLILAILILTLAFTGWKSWTKGIEMYRKEKQQEEMVKQEETIGSRLLADIIVPNYGPVAESTTPNENARTEGSGNAWEQYLSQPDTGMVPWLKLLVLAVILVIIIGHNVFLNRAVKEGIIEKCSSLYWGIWSIIWFVVIFFVAVLVFWTNYVTKIKKVYNTLTDEIELNLRTAAGMSAFSFLSGIMSSLLGIGGGLIITPYLLSLGIAPEAVVATSSFMIFTTTLATTIQYINDSRVELDYALILCGICFVSAVGGQYILDMYLKKSARRSTIVFILLAVIVCSTILLTYVGIDGIVKSVRNGQSIGFRSYCAT